MYLEPLLVPFGASAGVSSGAAQVAGSLSIAPGARAHVLGRVLLALSVCLSFSKVRKKQEVSEVREGGRDAQV